MVEFREMAGNNNKEPSGSHQHRLFRRRNLAMHCWHCVARHRVDDRGPGYWDQSPRFISANTAATTRFIRFIRVAILNLAGVPSIVFGLFGFGLFVIFFGWNVSLLAGWFTLGLMILPAIITASEESLRAVPKGLREGSLALGATQLADDPQERAALCDARHFDLFDPRHCACRR